MKCLTVMQPWAWAILHAGKRIENRSWRVAYRGPILIHAGLSTKWMGISPEAWRRAYGVELPGDLVFGHVLGVVDVVDCVRLEELPPELAGDPYAEGPLCWILANPRPLAEPIPLKGRQQLYHVPRAILDRVNESLQTPLPRRAVPDPHIQSWL